MQGYGETIKRISVEKVPYIKSHTDIPKKTWWDAEEIYKEYYEDEEEDEN